MVKGQPGRQEAVRGRLPGRSCSDHDYMEEKARVMKETERDAPPPPDFPHCHSQVGLFSAEDQLRCPKAGPEWGATGCLGDVGCAQRSRNVRMK